jgi:carboxypeptidase PM20D1
MIKRALYVLGALVGLVLLLASVLAVNAYRQGSRQISVPPLAPLAVDKDRAAQSLAGAVQARTVSGLLNPEQTALEFQRLQQHLRERYPRLHQQLQREVFGDSLVYTWPGRDAQVQPVVLMAHQDVVPIPPGTETLWKQPPFEGRIEGGVVWGRGAMDNKGNLVAQFEAVEMLLASGFQPRRTLYFVLGADEELGGRNGALKIAQAFRQRGIRPAFVLDEGLWVTEGILPGIAKPVALVGIAEKGGMSLRLSVDTAPGHSSAPPAPGQSAIGVLAGALARVDAHPVPGGLRGVAAEMFEALAPEFSAGQRIALSNLWLLRPIVERMLEKSPATNALMRTTTALTIVNAGNKENVLPGRAEAVVNFRILPGDTPESIEAHVRKVIADDRVRIERVAEPFPASPISPTGVEGYRHVERGIREIFPDAIVAPSLYVAGADARHFDGVADAVYRFTPVRVNLDASKLFHGTDERIPVDHLADMVRFYHRLLQLAAGPSSEGPSP